MFFFAANYTKAQLWYEDFSGESDGAQNGNAGGTLNGTWTVDVDPSGTFAVDGDEFVINNTVSEGTWSSNAMDISTVGYAIIDIGYGSAGLGFSNSDYIRFYYRIDGGPEVLFANIQGNVWDIGAAQASAIVAGNSLEVIIKAQDNSTFWFLSGVMWISDVTVTAAPTIYSRASGSWTNAAAGTGTWSLTGHSGASCACYPLNTQVAIVGAGHTVTLPVSQTNTGTPPTTNLAPGAVDVYGTLQYNTNGVTLGVQQGLFRVRSTGAVNSSSAAITGEQISFQANIGGATLLVDAGGSMSVEDLVLGTGATNFHYLEGGGTLAITDDVIINADGASLTNNRTVSFTVSDDLDFSGANSAFVNNGPMTISDDVLMNANNSSLTNNASSLTISDDLNFNSDNNSFTNNTTASIGDIVATDNNDDDNVITNSGAASLTLGGIDANNADLDIFNSGTITQSGDFADIDNGDTNFDNLATGTWNWTLTPNTGFDTDVAGVLNLTAIGNTFTYNGAGAQRIIPTTYHHINLSNSGAKDANNASFAVRGNWTVSGTATFTEGTGTVTLDGSVAQVITNPSGETFRNLVIDNSFGASPQITINGDITVSNILTMNEGNVNLNGYSFSLTSTASGALVHGLAAADGWMYGGNFTRARPSSAAFMSTAGAAEDDRALFPLGSAGDWRPFFVGQTSNGNTGGTMTVSHTNSTSTSDVSIPDTNPNATIAKRHNSYWTVSTSGIGSGATFYLRAGGTNFGVIANVSHLRMATSSGVVGTNIAGAGTTANPRVRRSVAFADLANNFHLASTNAGSSPLPIELLSFSAQLKNNFVELKWSTASETNNDFFTIERSTNVEHFEPILTHDGSGTTKEMKEYNIIDSSPLYGRSYYRLKQTDFDGQYTYSAVRVIDYDGPEHATLSAFPNPSSGKNLSIRIEGLRDATHVPVTIMNMQGQKVYEKTIEVKTPGVITEEIFQEKVLPSGLYIIKAGNTLYLEQKIVIE